VSRRLLNSQAHLLVGDQTVKNCQNLLAVGVHALQVVAEGSFKIVSFHPLIHHGARYVNVLPEGFYIMAAKEKAIKECRFPLWRQGVEFISRRHKRLSENVSIPMPASPGQVRKYPPAAGTIAGGGGTDVPKLIAGPTRVEAAGNKPKLIDEYVGRVNSGHEDASIAHMRSPGGWQEPGQTPEFDEYTIVLRGMLRVEHLHGALEVRAGQAVIAHRGEWVRYGTPEPEGAEYIAVCLPAFSLSTVHRDD